MLLVSKRTTKIQVYNILLPIIVFIGINKNLSYHKLLNFVMKIRQVFNNICCLKTLNSLVLFLILKTMLSSRSDFIIISF